MWNNSLMIVGGLLTALGMLEALYVGRFLVGVGVGIESVVVPVLLSEIASSETRGTITTLHQLYLTVGIFLSGMIGYGFVEHVDHGWQYVQGGIVIPSVIMLVCYRYVPESPKWLMLQSRESEAEKALVPLRDQGCDIKRELRSITEDVLSASKQEVSSDVQWSEVFSAKKAVIIGSGLMFMSAMSGINTVIFYSTTIFDFAGFHEAILATASVGLVNMITTACATYFIDIYGRKTLLMLGMNCMVLSLGVLSVILICSLDESVQGIIAVLATLLYVFGFAIGLGSVAWVIMSEIVPIRIRTKAFSLFVSINWACNLLIGLVTLTAIDGLGSVENDMTDDESSSAQKKGVAYLYFIFCGICFGSLCFIKLVVPETKGKAVEELDDFDDMGGHLLDPSSLNSSQI